jgi:hypothetical protein
VVSGSATRLFVQLVNLSLDALGFFALLPDLVPIRALSSRSSVHNLEHILRWVLIIFAVSSVVVLEVI